MLGYIILFALIIAIVILKPKIKGYLGERNVSGRLSGLPESEYHLINNLMLPSDIGLTQIDHVIVSTHGIFVIETKNYKGWITGGDHSENWTKHMYKKKYSFRNPIKQNYAHVKALMSITGINNKDAFIPIIAFANSATLKVNTSHEVVNFRHLKRCILSHQNTFFTPSEVETLVRTITTANTDSKETRKEHLEQIYKNVSQLKQSVQSGICPKCGGKLKLRSGKYGKFYGCSNYPSCRFTKNLK